MNSIMDILYVPMGYILNFCYQILPNYALALLGFTVIMKLVLLPLGIRQQKNSIKQAKLRPKEMAIRKRYAGRTDQATQQKMQQDILDLYKRENYSPMGGCLPLFLQFPIIIALYTVIRSPLTYICRLSKDVIINIYSILNNVAVEEINPSMIVEIDLISKIRENADAVSHLFPEGFTIADIPSFTIFGGALDLAQTPTVGLNWLLIIPIFVVVTSWLSSKIIRKFTYQPPAPDGAENVAASMKIMDLIMPLMSLWLSFTFPAILGLYWGYQSVFSILQQILLFKLYPIPQFTEEEYRKVEKEMNGSVRKESKEKKKNRSLHHIDDDDQPVKESKPVQKDDKAMDGNGISMAKLKDDGSSLSNSPEKPKVRSLHHIDDEDYADKKNNDK